MLSPLIIEDLVKAALQEDLGHGFDLTSSLLVPAGRTAKGVIRARADGRLAGLDAGLCAFALTDRALKIVARAADGDALRARRRARQPLCRPCAPWLADE